MKKALRIGIAAATVAAVVGVGAVFGLQNNSEEYLSSPTVQTAVLKQGASGGEVKELQRRLKNWGYYSGAVDGIYGSQTVEAVKYFQRKNGLTPDGIAGRATFAALGMNDSVKVLDNQTSGGKNYSSSYTSSDLYLLAKCIYAEARGESYTGQVAVGAVIMNRVKSSAFPNTVAGVIYQRNAFTAVSDGQINLEPDKTAMNAASDALNGWDPTYGCLYYYNPAVATSSWIFGRKTVTTIGKHVFAI